METDAPRYARRMTSGAEPGAVKAASPVLNGEDEETGRKALRLVLTQRRGGSNQTRHVCRNCPTRWSLITRLRLKSPPAGRFVHPSLHLALRPVREVNITLAARSAASGGHPLWTPPESRGTESRDSKPRAPRHHHAKPHVKTDATRVIPVTVGAAHEPRVVPERAAPQHAG